MEVQARDDDGHGTYANPLCNMPTRNRTSLGASPTPPAPAPHCCTLLASLTLRGAGTPGDGFQCNVLYDKLARARFFAWCKERAITELYVDANGDAALRNATAGAALESFVEDSDKAGIDLQVRNIHVMLPSASPAVYFRVALLLRCGPAPSYDAALAAVLWGRGRGDGHDQCDEGHGAVVPRPPAPLRRQALRHV